MAQPSIFFGQKRNFFSSPIKNFTQHTIKQHYTATKNFLSKHKKKSRADTITASTRDQSKKG